MHHVKKRIDLKVDVVVVVVGVVVWVVVNEDVAGVGVIDSFSKQLDLGNRLIESFLACSKTGHIKDLYRVSCYKDPHHLSD